MNADYVKAKKLGEKEVRKARGDGRHPYLTVLDEILPEVNSLSRVHIGLQEIPLRLISGTKTTGRANAFARNFMPLMEAGTELSQKWSNLYDAQIEEGIRDPIQVFEYRLHFYVQEGNKRVSVLKYLDVPSIEADVTRIMPNLTNETEDILYEEFLRFFACAPIYDIVFSTVGSYERFALLVHQDLKHPWDRDFINTVRGAYFRFYNVFLKKGGSELPITPGDAFLLYLQVYRFDSLLDRSRSDIDERLDRVWEEVLLETKKVKVSFIKDPIVATHANFFQLGTVYNENRPLRILFIYGRDPKEDAWERDHEIGRQYIAHKFGNVIQTAAQIAKPIQETPIRIGDEVKNYDVVFTSRRELMTDTLRVAVKYTNVRFFNCSIFLNYYAVTGYFGRMYEAMFLLGRIAAYTAKNHKVGYVANAPIYGRIAEINAFAIGAALVDPEVKVVLAWSGVKDAHWQETFLEEDVQVYAGPDFDDKKDNQPVHGVRILEEGKSKVLAIPVWNWNRYYEKMVEMILDRNWDHTRNTIGNTALNCWWGMNSNVIDVQMIEELNWMIQKDFRIWRKLLVENDWNPFEGELHSQREDIQLDGVQRLPSEDIISMNWLNHNVVGTIPSLEELNEDMGRLASLSFVKGRE